MQMRRLRDAFGYKQQPLAEALGVTVSVYSRMEGGTIDLSTKAVRALAEFYGLPSDWILAPADTPHPIDALIKRVREAREENSNPDLRRQFEQIQRIASGALR